MVDLNATQAAIRAGYSAKTAYSQGQRVLKNVEVQAAIQKASALLAKRTGIEQEDVIRENQRIAFADIRDYLEVTNDGVDIKPSSEWTEDQARAVASVREHITVQGIKTIDLRLHDKQKALAEIAARLWPVTQQVDTRQKIVLRVVYRDRPRIVDGTVRKEDGGRGA